MDPGREKLRVDGHEPDLGLTCRSRPVNRSQDQEVLDANGHAAGER